MTTKPILFSADMIRALLDGRKTQTRRIVKYSDRSVPSLPDHFDDDGWPIAYWEGADEIDRMPCPYGQPDDLLWARETWAPVGACVRGGCWYKADGEWPSDPYFDRWKPSIHMPSSCSRLTLKITNIRAERVQDISESDAVAEGIEVFNEDGNLWYSGWMDGKDSWFTDAWKWHCNDPIQAYKELWDGINFKRGFGWDVNPWVWVIEFEVIKQNVDKYLKEN